VTNINSTNLERQLSELFRAETDQAHLPQGTWHQLTQRLGDPDGPSVLQRLQVAFGIPRWRNPMKARYVASIATVSALTVIVALGVMFTGSDESDQGVVVESTATTVPEPTPTQSPDPTATTAPQPTATPTPTETPTPEPVASFVHNDVSGLVFRLDGNTLWAGDQGFGWMQYSLDGERLQTIDTRPGISTAGFDFEIADGKVWAVDAHIQGVGVLGLIDTETAEITSIPLPNGSRYQHIEATNARVFIAGLGNDLLIYDLAGDYVATVELDGEVQTMKSADSSLLLRLIGGGILQLDENGITVAEIDSPGTATVLEYDGENLWVIFNDNVVHKLDTAGNELARFEHSESGFVGRGLHSHDGTIWAMFEKGTQSDGQAVVLDQNAEVLSRKIDGVGANSVEIHESGVAIFSAGTGKGVRRGFWVLPITD
jgi:hypothetical protein